MRRSRADARTDVAICLGCRGSGSGMRNAAAAESNVLVSEAVRLGSFACASGAERGRSLCLGTVLCKALGVRGARASRGRAPVCCCELPPWEPGGTRRRLSVCLSACFRGVPPPRSFLFSAAAEVRLGGVARRPPRSGTPPLCGGAAGVTEVGGQERRLREQPGRGREDAAFPSGARACSCGVTSGCKRSASGSQSRRNPRCRRLDRSRRLLAESLFRRAPTGSASRSSRGRSWARAATSSLRVQPAAWCRRLGTEVAPVPTGPGVFSADTGRFSPSPSSGRGHVQRLGSPSAQAVSEA